MPLSEEADKPATPLDEAVEWLLRLQERADDPQQLDAFHAWLAYSITHRDAWQQTREAWKLLGETTPAYEDIWTREAKPTQAAAPTGRPQSFERRHTTARRRRGWVAGLVAAGIAACLILVIAPSVILRLKADYRTATGQNEIVTLADGTIVDLGAGSALKLDFTNGKRKVELLAGEAFFDVTPDAARPFVVDAEGVQVSVLGTAFNVRLSSAQTTIELARGTVDVSYAVDDRRSKAKLSPGQVVVVDRTSGAMARGDIAVEDIGAWRGGRLFVTGATIGSVVEEIQRYHPAWIAVPDSTLADQKVTGLYDLNDPDRALRALVQPYGGKVREVSGFMRLLSRF